MSDETHYDGDGHVHGGEEDIVSKARRAKAQLNAELDETGWYRVTPITSRASRRGEQPPPPSMVERTRNQAGTRIATLEEGLVAWRTLETRSGRLERFVAHRTSTATGFGPWDHIEAFPHHVAELLDDHEPYPLGGRAVHPAGRVYDDDSDYEATDSDAAAAFRILRAKAAAGERFVLAGRAYVPEENDVER